MNLGGGSGIEIQAVSGHPAGTEVYACIRPEDVTLAPTLHPSSARNAFAARVTRVTFIGPLSRVELDCGFPLVALITRVSSEELGLDQGSGVYAGFKATAVHVIEGSAGR
ncbi:MAG: TOBE domain-containing protein [Dehalococcoidia bacterium]|nr:TOBE domain-containing protein [Dehalococcoidia bacterium]